jgi:hypothetical protein
MIGIGSQAGGRFINEGELMSIRHDPVLKGIFVQRNVEYKDASRRTRKPFCVTFPRLSNVGTGDDNDVIFPSDDFATFAKARDFALQFKKCDPRLRDCPIYLLDQRWVGSSTKRELQRIG